MRFSTKHLLRLLSLMLSLAVVLPLAAQSISRVTSPENSVAQPAVSHPAPFSSTTSRFSATSIPQPSAATQERNRYVGVTYAIDTGMSLPNSSSWGRSSEEVKLVGQTKELVGKLGKVESSNDRLRLEEKLSSLVEDHFDLRTEYRTRQITELEQRLEKLRNELSQRRSMKDEIVRLRVETLVKQSQGLGF